MPSNKRKSNSGNIYRFIFVCMSFSTLLSAAFRPFQHWKDSESTVDGIKFQPHDDLPMVNMLLNMAHCAVGLTTNMAVARLSLCAPVLTDMSSWSAYAMDSQSRGGLLLEDWQQDNQEEPQLSVSETNEFLVNAYTSGSQVYPVVASLSDGGFVIAWQDNGYINASNYSVYAQRYFKKGLQAGDIIRVGNYTAEVFATRSAGSSYRCCFYDGPRLAVTGLADGGFVILVTDEIYYEDSTNYYLYGQIYDKNGKIEGGPFQVNTERDLSNFIGTTSVASFSSGGFFVTWSYYHFGTSYIYGRTYSEHAVSQSDIFSLSGTSSITSSAALATGEVVSSVEHSLCCEGYGVGFAVNVFSYNAYGEKLNGYYAGEYFAGNSVAGLTGGGWIIAFGYDAGIAYRRKFTNSSKLSDIFTVTHNESLHYSTPSAAGLADGGFVVTWKASMKLSYNSFSNQSIYGQLYNQNGSKVGDQFQANMYTSEGQLIPSTVGLVDGDSIVVWAGYSQDGEASRIFGHRFNGVGKSIPVEQTAVPTHSPSFHVTALPTTVTFSHNRPGYYYYYDYLVNKISTIPHISNRIAVLIFFVTLGVCSMSVATCVFSAVYSIYRLKNGRQGAENQLNFFDVSSHLLDDEENGVHMVPCSSPSYQEEGNLTTSSTNHENPDLFDKKMLRGSLPIKIIPADEITLGHELGRGRFGVVYVGQYDFQKVAVKRYKGGRFPKREAGAIQHEVSVM